MRKPLTKFLAQGRGTAESGDRQDGAADLGRSGETAEEWKKDE